MPAGQEDADPVASLEGLGLQWETDTKVRRKANKHDGRMIFYPSVEKDGVIDFDTIKLNHHVVRHLLEYWLPIAPDRKTPHVDLIKPEVRFGFNFFSHFKSLDSSRYALVNCTATLP